MTPERPQLMDWLLLIYLLALATTPVHIAFGIPFEVTRALLGWLPHSFFLTALALILIRTLIPALRFDFGLSGSRWASLIAILMMEFLFLLGPIGFLPALMSSPAYHDTYFIVGRVNWSSIPVIIVHLAALYVFVMLFAGRALGPKRRTPA